MAQRASKTWKVRRGGFTIIELLLAGVITAFVVGSVAVAITQITRTKNLSRDRFDCFMRADAALDRLRRDMTSIIRHDDLFWCRVLIETDSVMTDAGVMPRSDVLLFTNRLRPIREIDYNGEGTQFESHYRVVDDANGSVLWNRLDPVLDEYPMGGGIATPVVDGIAGLLVEAYDGDAWYDEWDSDYDGIPLAVRVTITAADPDEDGNVPVVATLRTVVAMDRVPDPRITVVPEETEEGADGTAEEGEDGNASGEGGTDRDGQGGDLSGGGGGRGGRGDGSGGGPGGGPGGGQGGGPGGGDGPRGGPNGGPNSGGAVGNNQGPRRNATKSDTRLVRPQGPTGSND